MRDDECDAVGEILFMISVVVALALGIYLGHRTQSHWYQEQAIEKGYAEYHNVTGKWQWKEE